MYSFNTRIRYSETGEDGRLSLLGLIDYLQDCSVFQTEEVGHGIDYLRRAHLAWLLAAWQIQIVDLPRFFDEAVISTWCYQMKGLYGYRNFTIKSPSGRTFVQADSLWFLFDTELGRPIRPPEEEATPFACDDPRLDMPKTERVIHVAGDGQPASAILVTEQHLDTNHHVNNAQYVEMARNALGRRFDIETLHVQYKSMARLGDTIIPMVHDVDGGYVIDLQDTDGQSYAIVKMEGNE